jgi:hypothetical protein
MEEGKEVRGNFNSTIFWYTLPMSILIVQTEFAFVWLKFASNYNISD